MGDESLNCVPATAGASQNNVLGGIEAGIVPVVFDAAIPVVS